MADVYELFLLPYGKTVQKRNLCRLRNEHALTRVFTVIHVCDWLLHAAMILNAQVTTNQKTPDLHVTAQLDPRFAEGGKGAGTVR